METKSIEIYCLLFLINLLCGWVFLLKNEETIDYSTKSDKSIRDAEAIGVFIALLFGFILLFGNLIKFGGQFFYKKCKD